MKLLLVDDELELVSTLAERLEMRGIDVRYASAPEEALRILQSDTFDLAVLDVKMPRVDGLTLKKRMQEMAPALKFIFVTGHGSARDFETGALEVGEAYYLVKPLKLEALLEKMYEALGEREASHG